MADTRSVRTPMAVAAAVLIVVGLALWGLFRFVVSGEPHAYAPAGRAPTTVTLTKGVTYRLTYAGGQSAAADLGVTSDQLRCTITAPDGEVSSLHVSADSTKATDSLASFAAPVSGHVHVACNGLDQVFVEGAGASPFDTAGLFLVLATIALVVGVPLALSVARRPAGRVVEPVAEHRH